MYILTRWVDGTPTSEVTPVTIWQIRTPDLGHQMVTVMAMNDLLPPPLFNVNRSSHSEIQLFQNLTMKILGQGHACGQRSRSHLTSKIQRWMSGPRSNVLVTFEAWSSIGMFAFVSWQYHFGLRYSKFHIWPWKFRVNVMAKVKSDGHMWGLKLNWYVWFLPLALSGRRGIVVASVCPSVRPSVCPSVNFTLSAR